MPLIVQNLFTPHDPSAALLLYASSVATRKIHLAPPGNRTRTFAVGARCHNHYATGNWWVLQTHYLDFQLALYKTLLHTIATHSPANNTLPALQKTKLHILRLPQLLLYKGFTISKLISFVSWETVAYRQMRVCFAAHIWLSWVIEPKLLRWELLTTTSLLQTAVASSEHIRPTSGWPWKRLCFIQSAPICQLITHSQPCSHFI